MGLDEDAGQSAAADDPRYKISFLMPHSMGGSFLVMPIRQS
jgi:hypothetical protein